MGKQEFGRLLEAAINDSDVAESISRGKFPDLGEGELTEPEQSLLRAAASELAEDDVAGFNSEIAVQIDHNHRTAEGLISVQIDHNHHVIGGVNVANAFDYFSS